MSYILTKSSEGFSITDSVNGTFYHAWRGQTLAFADASVSLGIGDLAASIPAADLRRLILLYTAFFDRVPDAIGVAHWIGKFKGGMTVVEIADSIAAEDESIAAMDNGAFVQRISRNVFGSAPTPEPAPNWIESLDHEALTRGQVVRIALSIGESYKGSPANGDVAALLDNKYAAGFQLAVQQGLSIREQDDTFAKARQISAAVTPTGISAAIALAGAAQPGFSLYTPAPRRATDPITLDALRACPASLTDHSPDFYQCLVGHATGATDTGGEPCTLTVHEDGRFVVSSPAGQSTTAPPFGVVTYSKLDHTREEFMTMAASITGTSSNETLFSMAFVSPALAEVIVTTPGIRLTSGAHRCTLGV